MPFCDVYIGSADELLPVLRGEPVDPSGPPAQLSRMFPPAAGLGYGAFSRLLSEIQRGTYPSVATDWGSSAALVTRAQIERFIDDVYGPPGAYEARHDGTVSAHLVPWMRDLRAFVATLSPHGYFSLVAIEL
jgi:hypothetical protein